MHLQTLPAYVHHEAAFHIARRLLHLHSGNSDLHSGNLYEPADWLALAPLLSVRVLPVPPGYYFPGGYAPERRTVFYNPRRSKLGQCRVLVHEYAHALLEDWHPPQLYRGSDLWRYDTCRIILHHAIAREVEMQIFFPTLANRCFTQKGAE